MPADYYRFDLHLPKPAKDQLRRWQRKILEETGHKVSLTRLAGLLILRGLEELEKSP